MLGSTRSSRRRTGTRSTSRLSTTSGPGNESAGEARRDPHPRRRRARPESRLTCLSRYRKRFGTEAGFGDVRVHDLRHSYASRALALGESLTMIGKLLGHMQVQTTARCAHLARDSIQNAAARITGSIGGNLSPDGERATQNAGD